MVSVVIAARNAEATLGEQLDALVRQDYDGPWEVVVADNGSRDGTAALAAGYAERLPHLVVVDAGARLGPAAARNAGARAATGDVLAFCDADDAVDLRWLATIAAAAREHPLVAGAIRVDGGAEHRPMVAELDFLPFADTCCMAVHTSVFHELGDFDESYLRCSDKEFSWRAHVAGWPLTVETNAVVIKRTRASRRQRLAQLYRWAVCEPRLYSQFAEHGMPRSATGPALADHMLIVAAIPVLWVPSIRAWWRCRAPLRVGRLVGSFAVRRRYL